MNHLRYLILTIFLLLGFDSFSQLNHKHFILMGRIDLSEENYSDAMYNFNKAIIAKPNDFEGYFLRGIAKYSLNDYIGAVNDFSKTLEIHPLYVRAYLYRGIANDRLGNYADAKKDYTRAISLDPYDAELHIAMGSTKLHLNEFESAVASFDTAIIIHPDNANAYINRGIAKRYLERLDDAIADLDKAVYYDFFNVEALVRRGIIQMEREQYKDALLDFNNALKMDNNNPIIFFNRGTAFLNIGDTISALKDYERVNNLDERNALTYFNRGIIYAQLEENDIALALFNKVVEINPKNIYGYFNRGILHYKMNELDNAENDFSKVIELFPDYVDAWVNRSIVRYEKGDSKGADADRFKSKEIIELISNNKNVDSLYNIYSNSIGYDKIIAFDSDFTNGDKGGKLAQFSSVDIKPFDNFIIGVDEFNSKDKNKKDKHHFVDATLSQINENKQLNGLRLVYLQKEFSDESYQSLLNDSIIETIDDENLRTFLSALLNYEIHNYQHAENNLYYLIDNNIYYTYAAINISSIQKDKAELILANQNYNDPVSINTKKTTEKRKINKPIKPDYQQALNTLTELSNNNKTNPFIWYNLGNIHLQMQEFHKAIDDYSLAIKYEKNLAEAYYNRGLTLLFLGEKDLANSDLSKAGELGIKEAYAVIKRFIND